MADTTNLVTEGRDALQRLIVETEQHVDADVLGFVGLIAPGIDLKVRDALESLDPKRPRLAVILHTGGGQVEVAERIVDVMRHHYNEVTFIVCDVALSAGTVIAMAGDAIMMDYFGVLGPIDPQLVRNGRLVPALSYIIQYDRLIAKATNGQLTDAEFALLDKFDQAELHQFEMQRDLSTSLIEKWLAKYKFKDWKRTETSKKPVTAPMRETRAREIASALADHSRWMSHGRGISMKVLVEELNLKIVDLGKTPELLKCVRRYLALASDLMARNQLDQLTQTRSYF